MVAMSIKILIQEYNSTKSFWYNVPIMAGYSKKTLAEKLGIKNTDNAVILNAPSGYTKILNLPQSTQLLNILTKSAFIQYFTKSKEELEALFPKLKSNLTQNGILWISWPKGNSKVKTDLNETQVQKIGLINGLVDVKVVAIDEVWSGLKFVYRLKDRKETT